ncbi:hypothetical protein INR49_028192, partial [Caranx melampygus]
MDSTAQTPDRHNKAQMQRAEDLPQVMLVQTDASSAAPPTWTLLRIPTAEQQQRRQRQRQQQSRSPTDSAPIRSSKSTMRRQSRPVRKGRLLRRQASAPRGSEHSRGDECSVDLYSTLQ